MKTEKIAAIGAASVFAMVALLLAFPAMAATQTNAAQNAPSTTSTSILPTSTALTAGQTITLTSTNGVWHVISGPTASVKTGTASGTLTLTVAGVFHGGYALSLTSGSLTINGTTYSTAIGSAEMGPFQAHLVGQSTLASATPGSFLFAAGAHANFQGQTSNTLRLDVKVGGQEYGVLLLVTSQVS